MFCSLMSGDLIPRAAMCLSEKPVENTYTTLIIIVHCSFRDENLANMASGNDGRFEVN